MNQLAAYRTNFNDCFSMRNYVILTLLACCLMTCQEADTPFTEGRASQNDAEDFSAFYERFHSDSVYQMEHITFPLAGLPSYAQTTDGDFRWQKEDWQMHRIFDPATTGFTSEFTKLGTEIVVERIVHRNGQYGMIRRFARLDGSWHLIYYAGVNSLSITG